jgi:thiamine biosynthesis lipoprotein
LKKIIPVIILIIVLVFVFWQKDRHKMFSVQIFAMDTIVELQAKGIETTANAAIKSAVEELGRVDSTFGYSDSLIQELNAKHSISNRELYDLVRLALDVHSASSGAFSITLRPILDAWGFTDTHPYRIPAQEKFALWKSLPGDSSILLGEDGRTIQTLEGTRIDLGGIAKGYAADRAAGVMRANGITTGLINAGGDIIAFGDRIWHIGIKHPRKPGTLTTIPIKDRAIATSGDYERFFVEDGRRYCHILNPATGWPADRYISATVVAERCADADAWATALFVQGLVSLEDILTEGGMDWIVIDHEGTVSASPALQEYCPDRIAIE